MTKFDTLPKGGGSLHRSPTPTQERRSAPKSGSSATRFSGLAGWRWGCAIAVSVAILGGADRARAQSFEPAPEDLAVVADLLSDRVDLGPERIVYVAPGGGSDGDGTRQNPRRDLISVVREAEAGTAIHMAPGVYDMSVIRGSRSELAYNTLIGGRILFQGGWSSSAHHNLVIDAGPPIDVRRNQYSWWEDGAWPGIRGEFLIEDLGPSHPFFDLMPGYMQELAGDFTRARLEDNCYDQEPAIPKADFTQPIADVTGRVFDERHTLLTTAQRDSLFQDEAGGDYRRAPGDGLDCGSRIGAVTPSNGGTGGSAGVGGTSNTGGVGGGSAGGAAGTPNTGGTAGTGDVPGASGTPTDSGGGCGCTFVREVRGWPWSLGLAGFLLLIMRRRNLVQRDRRISPHTDRHRGGETRGVTLGMSHLAFRQRRQEW